MTTSQPARAFSVLLVLLFSGCVPLPDVSPDGDAGVDRASFADATGGDASFRLESASPLGRGGFACDPAEPPVLTLAGAVLSVGDCGVVTQIGCGSFSHDSIVGAIDVVVAEGRLVLAPLSGTVVAVRDTVPGTCHYTSLTRRDELRATGDCPSYGTDFGNYVVIRAADGTVSVLLAHLLAGSVLVREGDEVVVGTSVARAGSTGFSSAPHVHVQGVLPGNEFGTFPASPIAHRWFAQGDEHVGSPSVDDVYCGGSSGSTNLVVTTTASSGVYPQDVVELMWRSAATSARVVAIDVYGNELSPPIEANGSGSGAVDIVWPMSWTGSVRLCVTAGAETRCTAPILGLRAPSISCAAGPYVVGHSLDCRYTLDAVGDPRIRGVIRAGGREVVAITTTATPGDGVLHIGALPMVGTSFSVCATTPDGVQPATACTPELALTAATPPSSQDLVVDAGQGLAAFCGSPVLVTWSATASFESPPGEPLVVPLANLGNGELYIGARCPTSGQWFTWPQAVGTTADMLGFGVTVRGMNVARAARVCPDPYSGGQKLSIWVPDGTPLCGDAGGTP